MNLPRLIPAPLRILASVPRGRSSLCIGITTGASRPGFRMIRCEPRQRDSAQPSFSSARRVCLGLTDGSFAGGGIRD